MASARMRSCSAVRRRCSSDCERWAFASCSSRRFSSAFVRNTSTAAAISPISSVRPAKGIAVSASPLARLFMEWVIAWIGFAIPVMANQIAPATMAPSKPIATNVTVSVVE